MKTTVKLLILCLCVSWLGCNAQKSGTTSKSIATYFQEIPEKYRFGYSIQKEGNEWLRQDDQGMPAEMRKIMLLEQEGRLEMGYGSEEDSDSVLLKLFNVGSDEMLGISHFNISQNLNGGAVMGEVYFLKKENREWKEVTSLVLPKISIQDFYSEKVVEKEGYTALMYKFDGSNNLIVNLLVSYSAELDCMGGRSGEVNGKAQSEGCILAEKKKYDKVALKWSSEKNKFER